MVNTGVLYAITAGVSCITIYVVLNRIISTDHKLTIDKKLVRLLLFFCVFCFIDMIWGALSSRLLIVSQVLYTIFTYAFHLGAALSAFIWAGYVIHYLKVRKKYHVLLNTVRGIVLSVQIIVLISNVWNRWFFYVDADANYHSYTLRNFMFVMQFLYYIALIIFSLVKFMLDGCRKVLDKDMLARYRSAFIFSCVPLAFGFGQMLWPDASMYSLGFMLTSVLIYSYNVSVEREVYLETIYKNENNKLQEVVLGLSSDYQAIYLVNLDTDEYEMFGESVDYIDKITDRLEQSGNFFNDVASNLEKVVVPDDCDKVRNMFDKEHICRELATKKSISFNYRLVVDSACKYFLCKIIKVHGNSESNNRIIIGVFDDDGRIRLEAEQKQAIENALLKAEDANKAKTTFLFNMSHDIRTPMNSILGFTKLAQKHIYDDDREYLSSCLEKVSMSGNHLLSLINDVLDMARIESGKMTINLKPESIIEQNGQIVSIIQELASIKSIDFTSEVINVEKEWLMIDALHLKQIILNVLSNAVNYTKAGGNVHYSIEQKVIGDTKVSIIFTVRDNGIGMTSEFLEKIYDEFERENNATASGVQGTGLGMSIVKKLVDMMEGSIVIDSARNVGTTVTVTLDFDVSESDVKVNSIDLMGDIPPGHRVLLVDDNFLNREIASDFLEDFGVEWEEACDGIEAVDIIKKHEPGYFDIILMDIQMPRMNGYEATKAIRELDNEQLANTPIIAMTANAFEDDIKDAMNAGMNAHLPKPIDIEIFYKALKTFL